MLRVRYAMKCAKTNIENQMQMLVNLLDFGSCLDGLLSLRPVKLPFRDTRQIDHLPNCPEEFGDQSS